MALEIRLVVFCALLTTAFSLKCPYHDPKEIHIAFGATTREIVVTWSTVEKTNSTSVQYGAEGELDRRAEGTAIPLNISKYVSDSKTQYIHTVRIEHLTPNATYGKFKIEIKEA